MAKSLAERIAARAVRVGSCLIWLGQARRYVRTSIAGRHSYVHRFVLEGKLGRALQPGEVACHTCDNHKCVNAEHLWVGTMKDNQGDMARKGRSAHGMRQHQAKLTDQQVRQIRIEYAEGGTSCKKLGRKYGVNHNSIWVMLKGRTWRHVA